MYHSATCIFCAFLHVICASCVVFFIASYADKEQLQAIYSAYLRSVLHHSLSSHQVWGAVKNIQTLSHTMVSIYEQVQQFFGDILQISHIDGILICVVLVIAWFSLTVERTMYRDTHVCSHICLCWCIVPSSQSVCHSLL